MIGVALCLCNCQQRDVSKKELQVPAADTTLVDAADLILDSIFSKVVKLKMVQEVDQNIQKVTKGERGVAILLGGEPTPENPYYSIHVGYNGEDRFETYFFLKMNPSLDSIFAEDPVSGEWRYIKLGSSMN